MQGVVRVRAVKKVGSHKSEGVGLGECCRVEGVEFQIR